MPYKNRPKYVWPVRDSQAFVISAEEHSTIITESYRYGFNVIMNMEAKLETKHVFQEPNAVQTNVTLIRNKSLGAMLLYVGTVSDPVVPDGQNLVYECQLFHIARTCQMPSMLRQIGITNARIPWIRRCYLFNPMLTTKEFIIAAENYYNGHPEYRDLPAQSNRIDELKFLKHHIPSDPDCVQAREAVALSEQQHPLESPITTEERYRKQVLGEMYSGWLQ